MLRAAAAAVAATAAAPAPHARLIAAAAARLRRCDARAGVCGVAVPPATPSIVRTFATSKKAAPPAADAQLRFPGAPTAAFVTKLEIARSAAVASSFRVMDEAGRVLPDAIAPELKDETLLKMYKDMRTLNIMDTIFYDAQRQGRISFYMTSYGEEAATVGSGAALHADDVGFCQYREAGVLMWRGFTLQEFADQCFSNVGDPAKGRQMPVHYGSARLNIQTVSSPLTTQLPQASGAAYGLKLAGRPNVVACYFGEGAASEGDFHAALNFAATLECPVLFVCRNNGYAISTPTAEQYRGDGIISRAAGYGMYGVRVDGNDVLAVYEATRQARQKALTEKAPVLLELMTYRGGHHSTSDDSTRYRDTSEIKLWAERDNPITRFRLYLQSKGLWTDAQDEALTEQLRTDVLEAFNAAEHKKKAAISELFTDVYKELPAHLAEQQREMLEHVAAHPQDYPGVHDHVAH